MGDYREESEREFTRRWQNMPRAAAQKLRKRPAQNPRSKPLRIVYILPTPTGGGAKVILTHANHLTALGCEVTLLAHFIKPAWMECRARYVCLPYPWRFADAIPPCDVLVATYYDQLQELIDAAAAPVVFFEQGDEHLFRAETFDPTLMRMARIMYALPQFVITVSECARKAVHGVFCRSAEVFHNAVDAKVFHAGVTRYASPKPYLLMMGNPNYAFKNLPLIAEAFSLLGREDLSLYWITPVEAGEQPMPGVDRVFVSPPQAQIASLYRGAAMYVGASDFESFCLPALEAMACECPVLTTPNEGVAEYARDCENVLFLGDKRPEAIAEKMRFLLAEPTVAEKLRKEGMRTAARFSWDAVIRRLYLYYLEVADHLALIP